MNMYMKGNHWNCLECSDKPGFDSKGSLRAHVQNAHDIELQKLKMKEISRDDFEMETNKEYKNKMKGKQGRGGDTSSSRIKVIDEHEFINMN